MFIYLKEIFSRYLFIIFMFGVICPGYSSNSIPTLNETNNLNAAVKTLQKLTQYEIDHSFLLSQCIDNLRNPDLKINILKMKEDCESNVKDLSALLKKYNGVIPTYEKDFKGFFMEGYAAMRGLLTDQGVLKALHTNQKHILKVFESATESNLPEDILHKTKDIIEGMRSNLKHLESITN